MEKEKLTLEQRQNLKMARSYLLKVIFHQNTNTDLYQDVDEMIATIEEKLQP